MGRIVDLCGEVAAAAEEGPEGRLILPSEAWDELRKEWADDDIDDALSLVHDSLMQAELVEASDSLSAHMLDVLGAFAEPLVFQEIATGESTITADMLGQMARRVARLEEILGAYREGGGPDREAFDTLRSKLADYGIEEQMDADREAEFGLRSRPGPYVRTLPDHEDD